MHQLLTFLNSTEHDMLVCEYTRIENVCRVLNVHGYVYLSLSHSLSRSSRDMYDTPELFFRECFTSTETVLFVLDMMNEETFLSSVLLHAVRYKRLHQNQNVQCICVCETAMPHMYFEKHSLTLKEWSCMYHRNKPFQDINILFYDSPVLSVSTTTKTVCDILRTVTEHIPCRSSAVVVYLPTYTMCEKVLDTYVTRQRVIIGTPSTSMSCLRSAQVILTFGRFRCDIDVSCVVDFGVRHIIFHDDVHGDYGMWQKCTKKELDQNVEWCGLHTPCVVYRIMSKDMYDALPDDDLSDLGSTDETVENVHFVYHMLLHDRRQSFLDMCVSLYGSESAFETTDISRCFRSCEKLLLLSGNSHVEGALIPSITCERRIVTSLLMTSQFHYSAFPGLCHLLRIRHRVSEHTLILVALVFSLSDILHHYGKFSFFRCHGTQSTWMWLDHLRKVSKRHDMVSYNTDRNTRVFFDLLMEWALTVMWTRDVVTYNVRERTWRKCMRRWMYVCRLYGCSSRGETETAFTRRIKSVLRPSCVSHHWFPSQETHESPLSQMKVWYALSLEAQDEVATVLWDIQDSMVLWTHDVVPYTRRMFSQEVSPPRLHLDRYCYTSYAVPRTIDHFVGTLKDQVRDVADEFHQRIEARRVHRERFHSVICEIENDVAYRPGKRRYFECMDDFHFLVRGGMKRCST
jgi:hypothetical protein